MIFPLLIPHSLCHQPDDQGREHRGPVDRAVVDWEVILFDINLGAGKPRPHEKLEAGSRLGAGLF